MRGCSIRLLASVFRCLFLPRGSRRSVPAHTPQAVILHLGLLDTSDDAAVVYGSIALSLITVAMAVGDKTLHLMGADPGQLVLTAVYLCHAADAVSRTIAVALLFALDTTGLALGLGAAGMVLLDLAAQVWQDGRRRSRGEDGHGPLRPASWREVEVCGGTELGIGLIDDVEGCCDCTFGLVDAGTVSDCDGCICNACKACCAWLGRLLGGLLTMLQQQHGASVPGAVLSLFGPLLLSNRPADRDRVAIISGLVTAAVTATALASAGRLEACRRDAVVAAVFVDGDPATDEPVAVCLAALAVRLVLHGAVVRGIKFGSGASTEVASLGGTFRLSVEARGQMATWNTKDWAAHFAADF